MVSRHTHHQCSPGHPMATPWSPLSLFITERGVMMMMWAHWVSLDWVGAAWHWPRNDKGLTSSERGLGPHTALCTVCVWVMAIVIPGYCSELLVLCHSIFNIYLVCIVALFLFIPVLFVLSAFIFWQWQSIITRRNQEAGWGPPLHNIRGQMTLGHINQRWCIVCCTCT